MSICDLAVGLPSYRSRGPGLDFRRYQTFWEVVGLERGPFSLMRIMNGYLNEKIVAPA
jgi:hypothetical protein